MEIVHMAIHRIQEEPCSAPRALDESIKKYGILHPILLYQDDDGIYILVDGRRRFSCAVRQGLKTVPAIILPGDVCKELVGLSEHYSRSPSPAIEAEYFAALISGGMTQTELAGALGISQAKISQRLALREKLIPEFFEMLRAGTLIATVAREITSLDSQAQRTLLKQAAKGQRLTIKYLNGLKREKMMATLDLVPVPEIPTNKGSLKSCPHCGKEL
ncbi:MAG: ParB N-terminal domain-containing protein [Candidatus Omnitrophica bacterium]|nr:ParB N-terminal domain-containing protein [Candidatus Omnitrophota bacterium]